MSMTGASMFWLDALHDFNLDQSLPLPCDRYRLSNESRTGRGISVSFDFGQDLSHHFLSYALSNKIEPQQLALAIYYVFLFKLTNGERDLCIGMNINNRYHDELKSIIGLFENIIPLRCQLDPHWSFHQLIQYVSEIETNTMKYSYFPLQRILNQHSNVTKPAFLNISFEFQSNESENNKNEVTIGDARLHLMSNLSSENKHTMMDKFDFSLLIEHDLNMNQLSCTINASLDLFHVEKIDKIAQQFHSILEQLFYVTDNQMGKPIYELSLMLSDEKTLIESINNTQVLFPSVTCIHHEFVFQVMKHPQKLAVELDEQSLTYCELLHYVQVLSLNLMNKYYVVPGEIICQYVERSLSMVS
jgi:non-ribosomal peptide synthetase component F